MTTRSSGGECAPFSADPECDICGEAVDGRDAVTKAQERKPDVVVMDISMPNLNGFEATRKVRAILPQMQVLVLSQHDSPEMMRQAMKAGASACVPKSSMSRDLLAGIKKLRNGEEASEPATAPNAKPPDEQAILQRAAAFEKQLAESEERFRRTFEQAAVGMAIVAEDGRLLRVNEKFCDIVGYTEKELRALTYQEITHPADLSTDVANVQKIAGESDQYSVEKRYIRKDRSIVWAKLTVGAVRDEDRKLKYYVSVVEDITARKAVEEKLLQMQLELADTAASREAEAKALARLNDWNARLLRTSSLQEGLFSMLGAVIETLGADKGNVQLFDAERGTLYIAAQCGFREDFLSFFPRGFRARPILLRKIVEFRRARDYRRCGRGRELCGASRSDARSRLSRRNFGSVAGRGWKAAGHGFHALSFAAYLERRFFAAARSLPAAGRVFHSAVQSRGRSARKRSPFPGAFRKTQNLACAS